MPVICRDFVERHHSGDGGCHVAVERKKDRRTLCLCPARSPRDEFQILRLKQLSVLPAEPFVASFPLLAGSRILSLRVTLCVTAPLGCPKSAVTAAVAPFTERLTGP